VYNVRRDDLSGRIKPTPEVRLNVIRTWESPLQCSGLSFRCRRVEVRLEQCWYSAMLLGWRWRGPRTRKLRPSWPLVWGRLKVGQQLQDSPRRSHARDDWWRHVTLTSWCGRIWVIFIFVNKMLYWSTAKSVAVNGSQAAFYFLCSGIR
jgi:hypothetical protein